jgi:hypothetical protein
MDGAIDGSLWDLYRYALNAASFDFIAVTDHNYGAWLDTDEPESKNTDDVYQWWRTQKSGTSFMFPAASSRSTVTSDPSTSRSSTGISFMCVAGANRQLRVLIKYH